MKWILKVKNKNDIRLVVTFKPIEEKIVINSQYKLRNGVWVDFHEVICNINEFDLEKFQEMVYFSFKETLKKVDFYDDIEKSLNFIDYLELE